MALSFAVLFIATSLLAAQDVEGSGELVTTLLAPACSTKEATETLLGCRASFLSSAGENFTDDCEDGIVEEFMRCINSVQESCTNASAFLEKAFYDHYGCMETSLTLRVKRSWVRRFVCRTLCSFGCRYGEWHSFFKNSCDYYYYSTVCSYTAFGYPICRYVCGRVCRYACNWVWQWVSDRFGRAAIAPEDSDDLTPEEKEYIEETRNLCIDCVCSIGKLLHLTNP